MVLSAGAIATLLGGVVEGDPKVEVSSVCPIEKGYAGALTFLANPKYTEHIYSTKASVAIVAKDFAPSADVPCTLIRVNDPYSCFALLLDQYSKMRQPQPGIHPTAYIDATAKVGEGVFVGAHVVIDSAATVGKGCKVYPQSYVGRNAKLGDNSTLHPGARLLDDCVVGNNCVIHAGVTIGSDGFGFAPSDAAYTKVPQIGNVVIEDDVEIGANCAIDRGTMGSTIIRKGVKLDNLIQVAHNVEIGEHTVIAAQTGIAGSTTIGKRCMIGGQVGIIGHLTIGDNVKIAAQSGIGANVKDNALMQGSPAFDAGNYRRAYVSFRGLPKIVNTLNALKTDVEALKNTLHDR
jgi:UDP-3-O-[3-hydroxymyristoyl] glucosamine N-acyltransferase